MRNLLLIVVSSILLAFGIDLNAQANTQDENVGASQDLTLDVIGYFNNHDTLIYWINNSQWNITPSDTIKTAGVSTKVRLTVEDSTSTGYKMDYTFLEVRSDSVPGTGIGNFTNVIAEKMGKKIVGTTVHFETDEFGQITKFNNLGQVKRQAKSLFKEAMDELFKMPEIAGLKSELKINLKDIVKNIDSDQLVDEYLEELKLLFLCHGRSYKIGDSYTHEDATETSFENDTYTTVAVNSSDNTYLIARNVINIIPPAEIKDIFGDFVEIFKNEDVKETLIEGIDSQVKEDGFIDSYYGSEFFSDGWPYKVVKQTTQTISGRGKSTQTAIYLNYISE